MMLSSAILFLFLSAPSLAAPTASLDASALLTNGQASQAQNVAFQNLSVNDTCSTGEVACISGDVAQCADNQWTTSPCSGSAQCFALPSVRGNGTFIQCTSEKDATSVIDATGATGGIFGTDASNSTASANSTHTASSANSTDSSATNSNSNSTDTTSGADSGIVTVTITLTPTATVFVSTEVPVTTTLSPDEASSLLASLTGVAGGSVITASSVSATDAADVATGAVSSGAAASTIISLVPASAATP